MAKTKNAKRNKLMVVDDDVELLEELKEILTSQGYELTCSSCGETASKLAIKKRPDLIVMDINLGKITGFEVSQQLLKSTVTKNIPVIAITGYGMNLKNNMTEQNENIKHMLLKPFNPPELVKRIKALSLP